MLKNARMKKGLTQTQLGNLVGVSQSYIFKLENRQKYHVENATLKTITKLAKALNLKPTDVFEFLISHQNSKY
ncbi:helix-turn-helix domain-containing protein [Clostridium gasigenes]|uniref:helix-turn-helix domain-containing protein n=1 Tax=Clostridium gasigenes TaxID=94869 RepID=UPI001C0D12D2|nr:helix-turn-helix transcriptional regulator [Clostridium gasigenes]MBU3106717.1 helix-turn-helix transcriptional regulator [Clostridium gasigenes]